MKFKGIEKVNNVINRFVGKFGLEAGMGLDFGYYPISKVISYSVVIDEQADRTFVDFVGKRFPNIKADLFLWSLLHEVGHLHPIH